MWKRGETNIMAKAAVLGFGTVGSGVYEIIRDKSFVKSAGEEISIKYLLDIRDFDNDEIKPYLTKDFNDILNDDEINVVAEVMGGLHPAYEFTKQLLEKGVSVVTSNKELVATYGPELLELAKANGAMYMFEASVGGGIPVIRPMTICTKANDIERIAGILNGTTNYILNEMFTKGKDFDTALADAQAKGYAEKNPAADVEGHDACRKLAILSSMAWGKFVDYNKIPTEGICNITLEDVRYAEAQNSVIKLIGYADVDDSGKIYASVSPMLVSNDIIISNVNDVFNAVMVRGDSLGDAMFYGRGAGKLPTASAVVADIIDCVRHSDGKMHNIEWEQSNEELMQNEDEKVLTFFARCKDDKKNIEKQFANAEFTQIFDNEIGFTVKDIEQQKFRAGLEKINSVVSVMKVL